MRKLVAVSVLGLGVMGLVGQALAYDDNDLPPGLEKFSRGVVNIAVGVPDEVIAHTTGQVTEYGEDTLGSTVASTITGVVIGAFWGAARVGSGIVDVFTFPFPFNDNRPLVEPDHHV
jgi:putative exosortase-associated protein (TIGR04073 family)